MAPHRRAAGHSANQTASRGGKNIGRVWPSRGGTLLTSNPTGPAAEGPLGSQRPPHQTTACERVLTAALVQQEAEMCSFRLVVTYLDFLLFPCSPTSATAALRTPQVPSWCPMRHGC